MKTKLVRHFRELEVYQNAIDLSKLSDAETEATETQVWCEIAYLCEFIDKETFPELDDACDHIASQLVRMAENADRWTTLSSKHADTPKR